MPCSVSSTFYDQKQTHPDVVVSVDLLVGRVSTIVSSADGQEKHVESEDVGKVDDDRNGSSFPGIVGSLTID